MSKRKTVYYIELYGSGCGLSDDSKSAIIRREGTGNVKNIRPATERDIQWVAAMGGYVPESARKYLAPPK